MTAMYWLAVPLVLGLLTYLFHALLKAERF
jgi:K+-transporting ATPase KdpF subunit